MLTFISSPNRDWALDMAENMPKRVGLSINGMFSFTKSNGQTIGRVERIESVDLVDSPGGNPNGLLSGCVPDVGQITTPTTGTYTLRARAQSTGGTWTDWVVRTIVIGDPPTPVPTDTPVATATDVPVPTATEQPITPPILFTSNRDGSHEIYAMNPDGSNQTRLTNNMAMDIYPTWFPDHSRVVFASTRDGAGLDVYTMLPDGSSVTRLTTSSGDDYGGSVSPDGTQIAFVSSRDGDLEIFVMNADGSGQTQLTSNTVAEQRRASHRLALRQGDNDGLSPDVS